MGVLVPGRETRQHHALGRRSEGLEWLTSKGPFKSKSHKSYEPWTSRTKVIPWKSAAPECAKANVVSGMVERPLEMPLVKKEALWVEWGRSSPVPGMTEARTPSPLCLQLGDSCLPAVLGFSQLFLVRMTARCAGRLICPHAMSLSSKAAQPDLWPMG